VAVLRLFRGISVASENVDRVRRIIGSEGLKQSREILWNSYILDIRKNLKEFVGRPDLSTSHTRFYRPDHGMTYESVCQRDLPFPFAFACGDKTGAAYFANTRNRTRAKSFPLVVEFLAPVEDVFVDGKDFLYSAFRDGPSLGMREKILRCFGNDIAEYLDRAWSSQDVEHRIALCDLAVQDLRVINAHYYNQVPIGGRNGTVFRSAFMVRLPVYPHRILSIQRARPCYEAPTFSIHDFGYNPFAQAPDARERSRRGQGRNTTIGNHWG
jgi:hypothetical protein